MSSHTSAASLRRRGFIISPDHKNIISAHGPFLESFSVTAWEEKESDPTEPPVRVKVFMNACIDTVLPVGTTGHVIAVSEIHQENPGEVYKVYATFVHAADLSIGGYALPRCRFTIDTQPSTELPCQPKVSFVPESKRLVVLSAAALWVLDVEYDDQKYTSVALREFARFDCKAKSGSEVPIHPLFVCALDSSFDAVLQQGSASVFFHFKQLKQKKREKKIHFTVSNHHYEMDDFTPRLVHVIPEMWQALIGGDRGTKHMLILVTTKPICLTERKKRRQTAIAGINIKEPILCIEVSHKITATGERTVVTMGRTLINLFGLANTTIFSRGSIDFRDCPLISCSLITASSDLLAVASQSGEVKLFDLAAYRSPQLQLMPKSATHSDIIAFCPVYRKWRKGRGEGPLIDDLINIYALTSNGQYFFRTFKGPADKRVASTTVIANDIMGQCCYVHPWETTGVAAYGVHYIYLSVHRGYEHKPIRFLHTSSSISCCFVHVDHFVVCTDDRIAIVLIGKRMQDKVVGFAVPIPELADGHKISAYAGADHRSNKIRLRSIVGTSNGRVYMMTLDRRETKKRIRQYKDLQSLIDSPTRQPQFIFDELISRSFIEADDERIVSIARRRYNDDTDDWVILGAKGTLVRCMEGEEGDLKVLERVIRAEACPNPVLYYRGLTRMGGENDNILVIAEAVLPDQPTPDVKATEIRVINWESKEEMLTVRFDRKKECSHPMGGSGDLFVYKRSDQDSFGLLTLHSETTSKKKAGKQSIAYFEGIQRRSPTDQVAREAATLLSDLRAVYTTSRMDDSGRRSSSVITVDCEADVAVLELTPKGALRHEDRTNAPYHYSCSDFLSTPDSGCFVVVGCADGELLLVRLLQQGEVAPKTENAEDRLTDLQQLQQSDDEEDDDDSFESTVILEEEEAIEKVTIFKGTSIDIRETQKMLIGILTNGIVKLLAVSLDNNAVVCLATRAIIGMDGPLDEITMIGLGSLHGFHHDIWLANDTQMMVWRGRKGIFEEKEEEMVAKSTGLKKSKATVVTAVPVNAENVKSMGDVDVLPLVNVECVGTDDGRIGWWCTMRNGDGPPVMSHLELEGVGERIDDMSLEVFVPLTRSNGGFQFSMRVYILRERLVTVSALRFTLKSDGGITVEKLAVDHLPHFVRDVSHLSIEPSPLLLLPTPAIDTNNNDRNGIKKRNNRAQRIVVSGETDYEVLILCPEMMRYGKDREKRTTEEAASTVQTGGGEKAVLRVL